MSPSPLLRWRAACSSLLVALTACSLSSDFAQIRPADAGPDAFVRGCPDGYTPDQSGELCFRFGQTEEPVAKAQEICAADVWLDVPAHLAVIDSPAVRAEVNDGVLIEDALIGLYRRETSDWWWVTGQPLSRAEDDPDLNEGSGDPGADCVRLTRQELLVPFDCSSTGPFLCQWDFRTATDRLP